jgi:hypothetical protein
MRWRSADVKSSWSKLRALARVKLLAFGSTIRPQMAPSVVARSVVVFITPSYHGFPCQGSDSCSSGLAEMKRRGIMP